MLILALAVSASLNVASLDNKGLWDLYNQACIGKHKLELCLQIRREAFRRNQLQRSHEATIERWQKIREGKLKEI